MKPTRSLAIFHATFLVTGTTTVLIGVLLAHATAGDTASGTLMATQFSGQVFGSLCVTKHPHRTLAIGLTLTILAATALAFLAHPQPAILFVLGLGLGCIMSSVNTAAGLEVEPAKRASSLELLNVFWPIGAALAPPAAAAFGRFTHPFHLYALLAVLFTGCLAWLLLTRPAQTAAAEARESTDRIISTFVLTNLCLIAFLVIGVETAIAAWLPTLAQRDHASLTLAAAIPACYWIGSLLSRLAASAILRKLPLRRLMLPAAIATIFASALIPVATRPALLLIAAVTTAAAIAPLYPALLSGCVDLRLKGLIFMSTGLGSAAAPWLIGWASTHLRSLHQAMLLPPAGAILMLAAMAAASLFSPLPDVRRNPA